MPRNNRVSPNRTANVRVTQRTFIDGEEYSSQLLGKISMFLFLPTFLATTELHIGYRDYAFSKKLFLGMVSQVVPLGLIYAEVKRLSLLFEDASMLNPFNYKSPTNSQTNVAITQTDVMSSQNPAVTIA